MPENSIKYLLEIEIFDHDSKKMEIMTQRRELPIKPQVGHVIVVQDEVDRVESIIQDTDNNTVVVHLSRRLTTASDPDFDSIISRYMSNGWRPLTKENADG